MEANLSAVVAAMGDSPDLILRRFRVGPGGRLEAAVFYLNGLAEVSAINENILGALLLDWPRSGATDDLSAANAVAFLRERAIAIGNLKKADSLEEALYAILGGETVLLLNGNATAIRLVTPGFEARGVEKPDTEVVVRGSREGFTETLQVNLSCIRRRLRTPDLRVEQIQLGERSGTTVGLIYIRGLAPDKLVEEVRLRLRRIRIDGVLESGYIESLIEDSPASPFPTIGNTEKPDTAAAKLLEGRVVILVDGTPFALTLPYLFVEMFQVSEDYYSRPIYVTLVRCIRYLAFAVTMALPSLVVAVQTFQPELLPPELMITMGANEEGIPFPAVVQALGMILTFEVIKEAGVRLPRPVGQAVSIVGALVLGESAVRAGFVSNTMVVAIAFTGISGFLLPPGSDPVGILRYGCLFLSATFGIPGIAFYVVGLVTHLAGLRSFGVPYLWPLAPANYEGLKDVAYRAPWWAMSARPELIAAGDRRRISPRPQRPGPRRGGTNA